MPDSSIIERFVEVLENRQFEIPSLEINRENIDEYCNQYELNILEKAYILDINPELIFNQPFLKGFIFLELNREDKRELVWKKLLKLI